LLFWLEHIDHKLSCKSGYNMIQLGLLLLLLKNQYDVVQCDEFRGLQKTTLFGAKSYNKE